MLGRGPAKRLVITVFEDDRWHGKPVAVLASASGRPSEQKTRDYLETARRIRKGTSLKGLTIKELTHGGHKY